MNTTANIHTANQTWRNLCWATLLAVLFQAVFITGASAFSMQTPSIYTQCNHLESTHHSDKTQCLQHCASATDNYTQHYLNDSPASSVHADQHNPVVIYFNALENIHITPLAGNQFLFSFQTQDAGHSPIYQTTARLRI